MMPKTSTTTTTIRRKRAATTPATLDLHGLRLEPAMQRLVEFLKDLCRDIGTPSRTGVKIMLEITQSDIAALIGSSRKTVSLLFTDLEEAGLVKFYGRKEIYVPDVEKLE